METKKKSFYQKRIESLMIQNENESKTIKELLSPAAFEKLSKAQSALPQLTCRYKLQDFNGFVSKEPHFDAQLKKLEKKKPAKERRKRKISIWERRTNDVRNAEVKELLDEVIAKVEKGTEMQGVKQQSYSFSIEPKGEPLDGHSLGEQELYELWEPKVELLEVLDGGTSELKEPKETKELISYISVEQLSRLVELQNEPGDSEGYQKQFFQLSAVPADGAYGLIEIEKDSENAENVPFYFPIDQQSNFYVLN